MDEALVKRGIAAAAEYLRRLGWTGVEVSGSDVPPQITGEDGEDAVAVFVEVHDDANSRDESVRHHPVQGTARTDVISILVIAEDRALFRHHRAID